MAVQQDEVTIKPLVSPGKATEKPNGWQILLAVDQLANALTGGWADETISSRAYRNSNSSKLWNVIHSCINLLFFFQPNHCYEAYLSEVHRKQQAPELRK